MRPKFCNNLQYLKVKIRKTVKITFLPTAIKSTGLNLSLYTRNDATYTRDSDNATVMSVLCGS